MNGGQGPWKSITVGHGGGIFRAWQAAEWRTLFCDQMCGWMFGGDPNLDDCRDVSEWNSIYVTVPESVDINQDIVV